MGLVAVEGCEGGMECRGGNQVSVMRHVLSFFAGNAYLGRLVHIIFTFAQYMESRLRLNGPSELANHPKL